MGYYVGTNLSFSTNSLRRLKEVANKCLADKYSDFAWDKENNKENKILKEDFESSYTEMMLEQIADHTEKYIHFGNKGDMFIWGGVWNYYSAEQEIPFLKWFLKKCWEYEENKENIMFDFDRALLIVNPEQTEISYLYEFSWDKEKEEVKVRKSESDLNWEQY